MARKATSPSEPWVKMMLPQAGLVVEEMKSSGAEVICLEEKREEIEQEREDNARLPLDFAARRLWQRA